MWAGPACWTMSSLSVNHGLVSRSSLVLLTRGMLGSRLQGGVWRSLIMPRSWSNQHFLQIKIGPCCFPTKA